MLLNSQWEGQRIVRASEICLEVTCPFSKVLLQSNLCFHACLSKSRTPDSNLSCPAASSKVSHSTWALNYQGMSRFNWVESSCVLNSGLFTAQSLSCKYKFSSHLTGIFHSFLQHPSSNTSFWTALLNFSDFWAHLDYALCPLPFPSRPYSPSS